MGHLSLKRVILTMPVSIHRTTAWYSLPSNWHCPSELLPINPSPPWISHHGCWKAPFWHTVSTPRGSHFCRTPWQQSDPSGPSIQQFTYTTSDAIYVPNSSNLRLHVLQYSHDHPLQVILVRWRPFIKSVCNTIGLDFQSTSRTTANCAPLVPCQTCVPQTLWTSQATSDSQEALEFHIYGFHREAPSIFQSHLNSSHCWSSLKQSLFTLTHNTIMSPQLAQLFILHIFSKYGVQATSLPIAVRNHIPLLSVPWNCIGHEASLHSRYHPKGDGQTEWTNQTLEQYLQSIATTNKTIGLNSFH